MYELWACVIHIGRYAGLLVDFKKSHCLSAVSGPHHGHYVTIIKSNGDWKLFDDDEVTVSETWTSSMF